MLAQARERAGEAGDRWQRFLSGDPGPAGLVRFHTGEKMALLTRSRVLYDRLGRIAAGDEGGAMEDRLRRYGEMYLEAMAIAPTRSGHVDALQHLAGRLKHILPGTERAELADLITRYRAAEVALAAPLGRLREHFAAHPDPWATAQRYLRASADATEEESDG